MLYTDIINVFYKINKYLIKANNLCNIINERSLIEYVHVLEQKLLNCIKYYVREKKMNRAGYIQTTEIGRSWTLI